MQSRQRPLIPSSTLSLQLAERDFKRGVAADNGDCFPLSAMAGFEISAAQARAPNSQTTDASRIVREGAIGLLTDDNPIDGIDAAVFRAGEKLPVSSDDALSEIKDWRSPKFWSWDPKDGNKSASFQLGVALHLARPVAVIERTGNSYRDPARVYGARGANGALLHAGVPETIPTFVLVNVEDLLETLRARPTSCSLVEFSPGHFTPWILKATTRRALAAAAEEEEEVRPPSVAATEPNEDGADQQDDDAEMGGLDVELEEADAAGVGPLLEAELMDVAPAHVDAMAELVPPRRSARPSKVPRLSFPMPAPSNSGHIISSGRDVSNTAAFDVSGIAVGDTLLAKGLAPSGDKEWFRAQVTALRPPPAFPPITVKFVATEDGNDLALVLPRPRTAYVIKADTKPVP